MNARAAASRGRDAAKLPGDSQLRFPRPVALYRAILVPTDFSPAADLALNEAIRIARHLHVELRILHVLESTRPDWTSSDAPRDHTARSEAERKLDVRLHRAWSGGVSAVPMLEEGAAGLEIGAAACRERADLIVMGCHGWRHRYTLGAVAARVLTTAPCPVLTVHSPRSDGALSASSRTASFSCDGVERALRRSRMPADLRR